VKSDPRVSRRRGSGPPAVPLASRRSTPPSSPGFPLRRCRRLRSPSGSRSRPRGPVRVPRRRTTPGSPCGAPGGPLVPASRPSPATGLLRPGDLAASRLSVAPAPRSRSSDVAAGRSVPLPSRLTLRPSVPAWRFVRLKDATLRAILSWGWDLLHGTPDVPAHDLSVVGTSPGVSRPFSALGRENPRPSGCSTSNPRLPGNHPPPGQRAPLVAQGLLANPILASFGAAHWFSQPLSSLFLSPPFCHVSDRWRSWGSCPPGVCSFREAPAVSHRRITLLTLLLQIGQGSRPRGEPSAGTPR
jgi:hypothetical protein